MDERVNFADPDFEPSDEQLRELIHEAFAGVRATNEEALRKLRSDIADSRRSHADPDPK